MKKLIYMILIGLGFSSCGSSGTDDPDPTQENRKPNTPSLVYPSSNSLCIDNNINFQWDATSDPDNDAVTYNLQVALDNQFFQVEQNINIISGTSRSIVLNKGIAYYWRVKAIDSHNLSGGFSNGISFYTEGEGISNHLPFAPTLINPPLGYEITESTVELNWSSSDVDNDPLTFDIYFGNSNPPPLVLENLSVSFYEVNLDSEMTYYWKIVVNDTNGGQSIGQIWAFNTL